MARFLISSVIAIIIAALAYLARALNKSGAVAATLLGILILGLGGPSWGVILLSFFISASLLSNRFKKQKTKLNVYASKGSRRDAGQVLANGAIAGFFVLLFSIIGQFLPDSPTLTGLWVGFAASFAGANADTWATELGWLNRRDPVLLGSFKRVPKGTSGGVSLVGSLASLAGSALVAGVAVLTQSIGWAPQISVPLGRIFLIITIGGLIGSLVDSALGATLQVIYYCSQCDQQTERSPRHSCGSETVYLRGVPWLNNDWVNFACTLSAGLVGMLLTFFFN